uniref:F-box and leucine rich repeat protein 6 n=1 Tax=Ovis aries TaxID=9940 RepID=A0AC11EGD0_SHEEP
MLAKACPQLHSLDIQHSMVESTAVVSFLEEAGPRMQKLWLTYNSQTTAILGALLGSCCPQLQVLEVSTGLNHNITPLQLPVEALQKGCPQLQSSCSFLTAALEALFSQAPKGRISGLPTTSSGKPFQLWAQGLFCTERSLARRLKSNSFYPFMQQQPNVFVLEYYLDTLWKGTLLFIVCILLISFGLVSEVQKQETWGFPAYGVGVGLWLMISSLPRRRLVLNHALGVYHFSIQGRTVCQGPMHLVYVRLALNSDAYRRCFFQLVLCGHKLEPLVLVQLSERYEQMEYLGRYIARKLNINYFDCLATSYRHVVRHWPLGSTFSPGIVLRKTGTYDEGNSQWDPDV